MIDNNPITVHIVTTADELFLRHSNGQIWRYDNFPCGKLLEAGVYSTERLTD